MPRHNSSRSRRRRLRRQYKRASSLRLVLPVIDEDYSLCSRDLKVDVSMAKDPLIDSALTLVEEMLSYVALDTYGNEFEDNFVRSIVMVNSGELCNWKWIKHCKGKPCWFKGYTSSRQMEAVVMKLPKFHLHPLFFQLFARDRLGKRDRAKELLQRVFRVVLGRADGGPHCAKFIIDSLPFIQSNGGHLFRDGGWIIASGGQRNWFDEDTIQQTETAIQELTPWRVVQLQRHLYHQLIQYHVQIEAASVVSDLATLDISIGRLFSNDDIEALKARAGVAFCGVWNRTKTLFASKKS